MGVHARDVVRVLKEKRGHTVSRIFIIIISTSTSTSNIIVNNKNNNGNQHRDGMGVDARDIVRVLKKRRGGVQIGSKYDMHSSY